MTTSRELGFERIMRPGVDPKLWGTPEVPGRIPGARHPGSAHDIRRESGLLIERTSRFPCAMASKF